MTRSFLAAALLIVAPSSTRAQTPPPLEVLPVTPIHQYSFMQPDDPSLPSHVIPLGEIAAPPRSTAFPVGDYPQPSGDFRPAIVSVGARRALAQTFTVVDATGARVVEAREVWQMGWQARGAPTVWREVVPLPRDARPANMVIALRGRYPGLRLLRIERSSAGLVGSSNDLESCLGPSSAVARRFAIASGYVQVACYERGFATVHGSDTPVSLLSGGSVIWETRSPFHLLETPDGVRLLVEERPGRWRLSPVPSRAR